MKYNCTIIYLENGVLNTTNLTNVSKDDIETIYGNYNDVKYFNYHQVTDEIVNVDYDSIYILPKRYNQKCEKNERQIERLRRINKNHLENIKGLERQLKVNGVQSLKDRIEYLKPFEKECVTLKDENLRLKNSLQLTQSNENVRRNTIRKQYDEISNIKHEYHNVCRRLGVEPKNDL